MKLFTSLFLTLFVIAAYAQESDKAIKSGADLFFNQEYEKALKIFQKEYKKSNSITSKFWVAHCYAELNEVDNAKPLFDEIIRSRIICPERAMSLVNLANCYRSYDQRDSAFFYYDKAIEEYPKLASGYFNKGQLLYASSRFEEAKDVYDEAIKIEQDNWWYHAKRLEVSFASQDFEGALIDLKRIKELKPEKLNQMNVAYCYSMLKKYDKADSVFNKIFDNKDAFFLNNYGLNKHYLGESNEAIKIIEESLELAPENSYAYRNLGMIALDNGKETDACRYFKRAQDLNFRKKYGEEIDDLISANCK